VTADGLGVIFDGWAPSGQLPVRDRRHPHDDPTAWRSRDGRPATRPRRPEPAGDARPLCSSGASRRSGSTWPIVLITAVYTVSQQQLFQELSPTGWALSWLLLLVYGLAAVPRDLPARPYEREPLSLVFGALRAGAPVAATVLAGDRERGLGPGRGPDRGGRVRRRVDARTPRRRSSRRA
jgi:hypothetical protein